MRAHRSPCFPFTFLTLIISPEVPESLLNRTAPQIFDSRAGLSFRARGVVGTRRVMAKCSWLAWVARTAMLAVFARLIGALSGHDRSPGAGRPVDGVPCQLTAVGIRVAGRLVRRRGGARWFHGVAGSVV